MRLFVPQKRGFCYAFFATADSGRGTVSLKNLLYYTHIMTFARKIMNELPRLPIEAFFNLALPICAIIPLTKREYFFIFGSHRLKLWK
jgi:hypothetical protein